MEITFDPAKNAANVALRGLSFERVADFDFETAIFAQDEWSFAEDWTLIAGLRYWSDEREGSYFGTAPEVQNHPKVIEAYIGTSDPVSTEKVVA